MPGSARAQAIAALQSCSWRAGSMVEDQRGAAGFLREALRERAEAIAAGTGEAVGHHHDRRRRVIGAWRPVQPRGALVGA
jgi:hypothetical protein